MTFDDGIATLYEVGNVSDKGNKPKVGIKRKKDQFYFQYETLGLNRYYTALQNQQKLEAVITIPEWPKISTEDALFLENEKCYRIRMIQPTYDENALRVTKLSLERWEEISGNDYVKA